MNCFQGSLVPTHSWHIFLFFPMRKEILVGEEKAKDIVSLDFRRAFEHVSLKILRENLAHSEEGWRGGLSVAQSPVGSQKASLYTGVNTGPVLFNMLINGLGDGAVCALSSCDGDTKLGGVAGTPEGPGATQSPWQAGAMGWQEPGAVPQG